MGKYVKRHLVQGEVIEYETNFHWVIFLSLSALLTLFFKPVIEVWTSEFAITNKRVIIKTGLISRNTVEMNLQKIESVIVNQGITGRILGYGDLIIVGTGGTREMFKRIKRPITFRKKFQEFSLI